MTEASVSFAGNLTDQPELRHTEGGIARAVFRVVMAGRREPEASFFTVVVWRGQPDSSISTDDKPAHKGNPSDGVGQESPTSGRHQLPLAELLDALADELGNLDEGLAWQTVESARVALNDTMAAPTVRRTRRRR
jgi:hypothetical protein